MLSDSDKLKNVRSSRARSVNATTNKFWSDSQKIEAVTTYLALGNMALTSRVLKIPEITLRQWKTKDWWADVESELKVQENLQLSARLQKIIESTLATTEDRLANGDWMYNNKTGELMRKPVAMKDAHKITMDLIDKREHLSNKTPVNATLEAVDDRLKKLAEQFERMATKRTVEVTDVIIVESPDGQ